MRKERAGRSITCNGEVFPSLRSLERRVGIDRATIKNRLARGLSIEEAVSIPLRPQRKSRRSADGKRLCVNCRQPIEKTGNKWNHCVPCTRRYGAEHKRGVPRGTYIALWERQRGKCKCCQRVFRDLPHRQSPHIDHCHFTGEIRGLLCRECNVAIGIIGESRDHALALAEYITRHCEPLKQAAT